MNFFDHKYLGNHLLQLCPKVVKHPVYLNFYVFVMKAKGEWKIIRDLGIRWRGVKHLPPQSLYNRETALGAHRRLDESQNQCEACGEEKVIRADTARNFLTAEVIIVSF